MVTAPCVWTLAFYVAVDPPYLSLVGRNGSFLISDLTQLRHGNGKLCQRSAFCLEQKSAASPCTYYKDCWSTSQHRNVALQSRSILFCMSTIFRKLERLTPNSFHACLLDASNNLGLNLWNKSIAILHRVRVSAPIPVIKYLTRSKSWQKPFILAHLSEVGV